MHRARVFFFFSGFCMIGHESEGVGAGTWHGWGGGGHLGGACSNVCRPRHEKSSMCVHVCVCMDVAGVERPGS